MTQLTVRGVDPTLHEKLRGVSINHLVLDILRQASGLIVQSGKRPEYHDLDYLAGTGMKHRQKRSRTRHANSARLRPIYGASHPARHFRLYCFQAQPPHRLVGSTRGQNNRLSMIRLANSLVVLLLAANVKPNRAELDQFLANSRVITASVTAITAERYAHIYLHLRTAGLSDE